MKKTTVDVEIMGERFKISSDAEETHVQKVAKYVDAKMQEVLVAARPVGKSSIAMLAALNIADEYHRLKDNYDSVLRRLNHLSQRLSTSLGEEG